MIGENIKKYRKLAGLTQKELAERTGLAKGTIQQYELNKREPKYHILEKLANALNIDILDLLVNKFYTNSNDEICILIDKTTEFGRQIAEEAKKRNLSFFDLSDFINDSCDPPKYHDINNYLYDNIEIPYSDAIKFASFFQTDPMVFLKHIPHAGGNPSEYLNSYEEETFIKFLTAIGLRYIIDYNDNGDCIHKIIKNDKEINLNENEFIDLVKEIKDFTIFKLSSKIKNNNNN